jgi:thiosulfate dehydrogenase [quinone] large subunit
MKKTEVDFKALALMFLRVSIGWHMFYEGLVKLINPHWSSLGYLKASQGPFSSLFLYISDNHALLRIVDLTNGLGLSIVGLLLMLGLLTRVAAFAGMVLLLFYYLCTPPLVGLEYAIPTEGSYLLVNKTLIESMALFVIALFNSENYLGLDLLANKYFKRKKG